ncbi:MAG: hypothetical protein SGI87_11155 [Flavobacteriales bacterium]|nr:hypothetical protein [Flavobacteriales bacterium]
MPIFREKAIVLRSNLITLNDTTEHGRNVAIISYLWVPGWIIALILNGQQKTSLGTYHLRQSLGIWIISLLLPVRIFTIGIGILVFIMWIIGLISAVQQEEKPIPFIGTFFQDWFKGL